MNIYNKTSYAPQRFVFGVVGLKSKPNSQVQFTTVQALNPFLGNLSDYQINFTVYDSLDFIQDTHQLFVKFPQQFSIDASKKNFTTNCSLLYKDQLVEGLSMCQANYSIDATGNTLVANFSSSISLEQNQIYSLWLKQIPNPYITYQGYDQNIFGYLTDKISIQFISPDPQLNDYSTYFNTHNGYFNLKKGKKLLFVRDKYGNLVDIANPIKVIPGQQSDDYFITTESQNQLCVAEYIRFNSLANYVDWPQKDNQLLKNEYQTVFRIYSLQSEIAQQKLIEWKKIEQNPSSIYAQIQNTFVLVLQLTEENKATVSVEKEVKTLTVIPGYVSYPVWIVLSRSPASGINIWFSSEEGVYFNENPIEFQKWEQRKKFIIYVDDQYKYDEEIVVQMELRSVDSYSFKLLQEEIVYTTITSSSLNSPSLSEKITLSDVTQYGVSKVTVSPNQAG